MFLHLTNIYVKYIYMYVVQRLQIYSHQKNLHITARADISGTFIIIWQISEFYVTNQNILHCGILQIEIIFSLKATYLQIII